MTLEEALVDGNVKAFLAVIRAGEGTSDEDGYRRMFTGPLFDSFADHPRQLHKSGNLSSTAAGAYQFLAKTWDGLVSQYHFADFSPHNQDLGAVALIKGRGALADVIAGDIETAIRKCALEWASLPGSPYGQPTRTPAQALETYRLAGGYLRPQGTLAPVEDRPVLPFIAAALPALIQSAPALIRIFGDSPQAEKNAKAAELVADIAQKSTGQETTEGAVKAIQTDPEKAAAFREAIHLSMNDLLATLQAVGDLEQKSLSASRQFNASEPMMVEFPWLKLKFIHVLSLVFVAYAGTFAMLKWDSLTAELKGAVITLMIIAGWNGVRDYWMSSSAGSAEKTRELVKSRDQ